MKIAKILRDNIGSSNLRIDGHTDNVPVRQPNDKNLKDNEHLSALRAYTVYMYLVESGGLDPKSVFFAGWGKSHPIASNETAEGRKKNRRVEILILPPEGPIVKPE
ncbi:MAG: OmpA family protein [Planctomycetota bacterium]|nr:OmpA family protein [Planctomycetota bacterium]